jgi:hypothetical protein
MEQSNAPAPPVTVESVKGRYSALETFRQPYLSRGWDCSELTLPAILPKNGLANGGSLPVPWQSVGARGTNNLTAKLLMAIFPPNTPFFRLMMDELEVKKAEAELGQQKAESIKTQVQKGLTTFERAVMTSVEMSGDRIPMFEALKHLIIVGNVLLWFGPDGVRVYHLSNYVVRRDPSGNVLEIITKELVDPVVLPQNIRETIKKDATWTAGKTVDLYRYVKRTTTGWEAHEECYGIKIPESESSYPKDKCPWLALRFTRIDGEDYGRGYVEEHLGDLRSLEALTRAMVEATAAAAKVLFLVNPTGSTQPRVLSEAPNGAVRSGNAADVTVLHLDKHHDLQVAKALQAEIKQDLHYSFLMNSAVQRNAERVTAEEIRYVAQELEVTLGGFYSIMSLELQMPYVRLKIHSMQKKHKLPPLPKGVEPTIVTGLEALGRGNDRNKLIQWMTTLTATLGPDIVKTRVNVSEYISRLANADGLDTEGLVYDQATIEANQEAEQNAAMVDKLGPNVVNAGGKLMAEGMKNGQAAAQASAGTEE